MASLRSTKQLLDLNPEYNTVWNFRRDIISNIAKQELDTQFWNDELMFTMEQLKRFPKVYWIWNHRVWLLQNYPVPGAEIWKRELAIVNKMLQLDGRNYHGWHYRRIVVGHIEKMTGEPMDEEEFQYVTQKINEDISNYSAWHQRALLLTRLVSRDDIDTGTKTELIGSEVNYITNAMFTDADDQSVWFYIKWFLRNEAILGFFSRDDYVKMLDDLAENIRMINSDELEFSGKDNNWCLKALNIIEGIQLKLGLHIERHSREYLAKLEKEDPYRKEMYEYLISKL